ncbi:MAG: hypothetical protein EOP52_03620 [Sphingobacteriales bacterium]|nr:MAG: hypothetical protein EOP52_03620 [Sphingobacteriales bacterium]
MNNDPNQPNPEHPQATNPEKPTRATDPQAREIAGNVFEGLADTFGPDPEDKAKVQDDQPLEDMPQTKPEGE